MPRWPIRIAVAALGASALIPAVARGELPPGYYAASCACLGRGATAAEALARCEENVKKSRLGPRCDCTRHGDVFKLGPAEKPAFFTTDRGQTRPTRAAAVEACRREEAAYRQAHPEVAADRGACQVVAVYGPFKRKRSRGDYDDERVFRFLRDDGIWADADGDPTCFPRGTPVATPDGERPIEALVPGDAVLSWSVESGSAVVGRVVRTKRREARALVALTLADGRTIRVTGNHPLFVPARGDWIPAEQLAAGQAVAVLGDAGLDAVAITAVATESVRADVFDLTVEPTHAYFAAGVLAHNY